MNAVSTLLEKGADVAYCDYDERTALHVGKSLPQFFVAVPI